MKDMKQIKEQPMVNSQNLKEITKLTKIGTLTAMKPNNESTHYIFYSCGEQLYYAVDETADLDVGPSHYGDLWEDLPDYKK